MNFNIGIYTFILYSIIFGYFGTWVGGFIEYARDGGTHDLEAELKKTRRELEQSRELLYDLTHHASVNPKARAVTRGLKVVKG